jgi:hypothetical protein
MISRGNRLGDISHQIAQGLLETSNRLPHRSSVSSSPPSDQVFDGSSCAIRNHDREVRNKQHRKKQSSETWTSLSEEILPDQDDVEDRDAFVQEYNRLAEKVGKQSRTTRAEAYFLLAWSTVTCSRGQNCR